MKDDRRQVPLTVPRDAPMLYLSVLDYPSGWQIAAPSRTFIPELKKRWPNVTSIEVSDHTPLSELDLVRAVAPRYGAVVVSVFVRSTSGSGRLDLGPELVRLLRDLARITERASVPFITTFFGNPYTASFVPELPATLLTYDFYDPPERAAVARHRRRGARSAAGCRSRCRRSSRPASASIGRDRRATCCATNCSRGSPRWATRRIINDSRPKCSASAARRRSWRSGSSRRRWCSRIAARSGGAPASGSAATRRRCPASTCCKDADGRALYVGKAVHLRRRLRAHFAERRWRALKPEMSRAAGAEWHEVGSEIEALLREAALIQALQPPVNVQIGAPDLDTRDVPRALRRDVLVVQPSIEPDSVELIAAAVDGRWMIQRTRRNGADLAVHARRIMEFFRRRTAHRERRTSNHDARTSRRWSSPGWPAAAPSATRLDPHDAASARRCRTRLAALLADDRSVRRAP